MFGTFIDRTEDSPQPAPGIPPTPGDESFRPIHYLGSKLRVLPAIREEVDRLDPSGGALCDLFAGSGTVTYGISRHRKVFAVDIQQYSRLLCEALLDGSSYRLSPAALAVLAQANPDIMHLRHAAAPLLKLERRALEAAARDDLIPMANMMDAGSLISVQLGRSTACGSVRRAQEEVLESIARANLPAVTSVALRHYGGTFFSYGQALAIDAVRMLADGNTHRTRLLASLMGAVSHAVNTVGRQFAQPMRLRTRSGAVKSHLKTKLIVDRRIDIFELTAAFLGRYDDLPRSNLTGSAICADYRDALRSLHGRLGIVYADPPYTRDHYSRFYHVLETLAVGDDPAVSSTNLDGGDAVSRGVYRADRHQSDFCIKSKAPGAFAQLFEEVALMGVPLLLSYSDYDAHAKARPRVVSIEDVATIARDHFRSVQVRSLSLFNHSKLNTTRLNRGTSGTREVLISCRPS